MPAAQAPRSGKGSCGSRRTARRLLLRGFQLEGPVVVAVAERLYHREELRARRFARLLELEGLAGEGPAIRTESARLGKILERVVAMTAFEQMLTQPEIRHRERVVIVGDLRAPPRFVGRQHK